MTIPEAVSLVLQASILGNGGEDFVKKMEEFLDRRLTARPRGRSWKKEEK